MKMELFLGIILQKLIKDFFLSHLLIFFYYGPHKKKMRDDYINTKKYVFISKASKMLDFYQFLSLVTLALQVSRDFETNFETYINSYIFYDIYL